MKSKSTLIASFFVLFLLSSAYGQIINLPDNAGAPLRERKYSGVEGSPYLFDKWLKGDILLTDTKTKEDVPIRYNIHEDQVEIVNNGQTLALHPGAINGFTIYSYNENGNRLAHRFQNGFAVDSYSKNDFFQVLYEGENKLLVKLKNELVEGVNNSYGASMGDRFEKSKKYYLVKKDGKAHEIKLRKRDLKKLFPEKAQEMKNFQREQGVDLKSEEGVISFLQYLEQES